MYRSRRSRAWLIAVVSLISIPLTVLMAVVAAPPREAQPGPPRYYIESRIVSTMFGASNSWRSREEPDVRDGRVRFVDATTGHRITFTGPVLIEELQPGTQEESPQSSDVGRTDEEKISYEEAVRRGELFLKSVYENSAQ